MHQTKSKKLKDESKVKEEEKKPRKGTKVKWKRLISFKKLNGLDCEAGRKKGKRSAQKQIRKVEWFGLGFF